MRKIATKLTCKWLIALLAFAFMAFAPPAMAQYNTADITAINTIISTYSLGTPASPDNGTVAPSPIGGVLITWTGGRLTGLSIENVTLNGTLNVSGLTALETLICNNNQLTGLNFGTLTSLKHLICTSNPLGALDVSGLTALVDLNCTDNLLTNLTVSGLPNLQSIACNQNQLATLNLSTLPSLISLMCDDNLLQTLDVSGLTSLEILDCGINQLQALEVSMLPSLQRLMCYENQLATLDVSGLTALHFLACNNNQLTDLDVSGAGLQYLYCGYNQLTELEVSTLTGLFELVCYGNQLEELDVSLLTSLTELDCRGNQLTELDASQLAALQLLYCTHNQLTELLLSSSAPLSNVVIGNQTLALTMVWDDVNLQYEGAITLTNVSSFTPSAFTHDGTNLIVGNNTNSSVTVVTSTGVTGKDLSTTINLTYVIPVTGVSLNKTTTTIIVGATEQLTATIAPNDATDPSVTWSSSNDNVATVAQDGTITAVAAGNATITVTTTDGNKTASCVVTVNVPTYTVTVNGGTGATGAGSYAAGATVSITAGTAPAGQVFSHWTASPSVTFANANSASTSFTMPANAVTVTANFAAVVPPAPDPDLTDIYTAIDLIQFSILQIPQAAANTESEARKWIEEYLREQFNARYLYVSVTDIRFSLFEAAIAGSATNANGTHGAVTFSALFSKGIHTVQVTFIHGRIVATPYVSPTGNEVADKAELKAVSDNGALLVSGLSVGDELRIYNVAGMLIYNVKAEASEVQLDVDSGIYIVSVGKRTVKVAVR
jgi:Leucine-rich repeat (LRR) protein